MIQWQLLQTTSWTLSIYLSILHLDWIAYLWCNHKHINNLFYIFMLTVWHITTDSKNLHLNYIRLMIRSLFELLGYSAIHKSFEKTQWQSILPHTQTTGRVLALWFRCRVPFKQPCFFTFDSANSAEFEHQQLHKGGTLCLTIETNIQ